MYQFASKRNPGGIIRMSTQRGAERMRRRGFTEIHAEPQRDMTVDELKRLLKARGLPVSGTKGELAERLEQSDEGDADDPPSDG